jgi:peptidoglycan hydrolase CwlO-like protein
MRRWVVIGWIVTGVLLIILVIGFVSVGTQLDQARIERDELQFEADDLHGELAALSDERSKLQKEAQEHTKTIDQLKAELERARTQSQAQPTATTTP